MTIMTTVKWVTVEQMSEFVTKSGDYDEKTGDSNIDEDGIMITVKFVRTSGGNND